MFILGWLRTKESAKNEHLLLQRSLVLSNTIVCLMNTVYHYMVDFTLPNTLSNEIKEMLPFQKERLEKLFDQGKLCSFASAFDTSKMWAIFNANSEYEVMKLLATLPLSNYVQVQISMLSTYNTMDAFLPQFSRN